MHHISLDCPILWLCAQMVENGFNVDISFDVLCSMCCVELVVAVGFTCVLKLSVLKLDYFWHDFAS